MITIAYTSPFIPPEWIAAHGLRPQWLPGLTGGDASRRNSPAATASDPGGTPREVASRGTGQPPGRAASALAGTRGVCRCAERLAFDHSQESRWLAAERGTAIVLTTTCDQMRYAAALLQRRDRRPVFLFNLPSTWQSPSVRRLYGAELLRLSRFLVSCGGRLPSPAELRQTLQRYDAARAAARATWWPMSDHQYAARLGLLRDGGEHLAPLPSAARAETGVPLALVGGPLLAEDLGLFQRVAAAGGRIVLDASEWGERTLPATLDPQRLAHDVVEELTRAYFDEIPDVFRRPNGPLYDWLAAQVESRGVRGMICWWRVSCDLWHAELEPIRQWSPVPVLDLDAADGDNQTAARSQSRLETFLEMLS